MRLARSAILLVLISAAAGCAAPGDEPRTSSPDEGRSPRPQAATENSSTVSAANDDETGPTVFQVCNTGPGSCVATVKTKGDQAIFDHPSDSDSKLTLHNPVPSGAPLVFLVTKDLGDWVEVLLPIRPNGSTGFVRKTDVAIAHHQWRIEVFLESLRIEVWNGDSLFLEAPVGVAKDNTPTPEGVYYTTELLRPPDPNGPYGVYAYGLSGFSEVLETFRGGPGQLGIHGTNDPASIGRKVSAGCIRMRNEDIARLAGVLPLGTPVTVHDA
ncbi:MAG: hypothetical protein KatS3mg008_0839 [Acidimicrobiales bacterium]|nr:MAG: hypothetical protein KatS3mg008_0839 [Acidimicrobiales bacterium]